MQFSLILIFHVCAGTVALLAGTFAIAVPKGTRRHAWTGIVFSVSMLSLAASGVYLGYIKSQIANVLGGLLTLYMIATGWMAARRRDAKTGIFDWIAPLAALGIGTSCVVYGYRVSYGAGGATAGVPAGMEFFLGLVVLLAATGDIRMLVRGGISGAPRIARHLWRMCFGLFIASGSFFMGRQQIFPDFIRKSNVLIFLTVLPLLLLIFWLVRIRLRRAYQRKLLLRTGEVYPVLT